MENEPRIAWRYDRAYDRHRPVATIVPTVSRTRDPWRSVPTVGDTVIHHLPDSTVVASRVESLRRDPRRGLRLRLTELVRSAESPFVPIRWIGPRAVDSFVRVVGPAKPTVESMPTRPTESRPTSVPMPADARLTADGYVEYRCDTCSKKSWRRPTNVQTTCRRCTKNSGK